MKLRFLLSALFLCLAATDAKAGIQITEVMLNPSDAGGMPDAQYEFIELYNDGPAAVNLQNWTIETAFTPQMTITSVPLSLPSGAFMVLGRTSRGAFNVANFSALTPSQYIELGAGFVDLQDANGEYLRIADSGNNTQAELTIRNGTSGWPVLVEGSSITMWTSPAASPVAYQDGSNWLMAREPLLDLNSAQNAAGGYGSPGRGPNFYGNVEAWTGAAGDGLWDTPQNWSNNSAPGSSSVAVLGGMTQPVTITVTSPRFVRALLVNSAHPVTLAGAGRLTVVSGHLNAPAVQSITHAFNIPIVLSGNSPWCYTLNSGISFNGGLTAAAALTKTGWGRIMLGANITLGARYVQSQGVLDLAGHSFSAPGFQIAGTLNTSIPGGQLRSTQSIISSAVSLTGLPDVVMQPGAGVFANAGLNCRKLEVSGAGTVVVSGAVCQDFDLVSGTLHCSVPEALKVRDGSARLRNGTQVNGFSANGIVVEALTTDCTVTNEGCLFNNSRLVANAPGGRTVTLGGSVPYTGLSALQKSGAGRLLLQNTGLTALNLQLLSGIIDLNGQALSNAVNGTAFLSGEITDSGTTGELVLYTGISFGTGGFTFTSQPGLTFRPAAGATISTPGGTIGGIGRLLIDGAGMVLGNSSFHCAEFDLKAGTFDLWNSLTAVTVNNGSARLRSGTVLKSTFGTGSLTLTGNSQLLYDGATLENAPGLTVNNTTGETVSLSGTVNLTGIGQLNKQGTGLLRLDGINFGANRIMTAGTVDLHGQELTTLYPGTGVSNFTGTLTDSTDGGRLRLRANATSSPGTLAGFPDVTIETQDAAQTITAPALIGVGTLRIEGPGRVLSQFMQCQTLDHTSGMLEVWNPSGMEINGGSAFLRSGTTVRMTNSGQIKLLGASTLVYEGAAFSFSPVFTCLPGAGQTVRLTGSGQMGPVSIISTGGSGTTQLDGMDVTTLQLNNSGSLDLNGRQLTIAVGGETWLSGTVSDSGTTGLMEIRGTLRNINTTFAGFPNLRFWQTNPAIPLGWSDQPLSGLGTVSITAGTAVAETSLTCRELVVESALRPKLGHSGGTEFTRFKPGSALTGENTDTGTAGPVGNGKLVNEGGSFAFRSNLGAVNAAGETAEFTGLPITGFPEVWMNGQGTLALRTGLESFYCDVVSGAFDTGGQVFNGGLNVATGATVKGAGQLIGNTTNIRTGARLAPAAAAGAITIESLSFGNAAEIEVPLISGASPILVPPGGAFNLPSPDPANRVAVTVTGSAVAGQTYNLMTWTGAGQDAPASIVKFRLACSIPGFLQLNAAQDTLQFVAYASSLAAWKEQYFTAAERMNPAISGPDADPDYDGLTNVIEYALAAHPRAADAAGRFDFTRQDWDGQQVLSCRFVRPCNYASEVAVQSQFSTDLTNWLPASLDPYKPEDNGRQEFIAWTPKDQSRKMLRVRFFTTVPW